MGPPRDPLELPRAPPPPPREPRSRFPSERPQAPFKRALAVWPAIASLVAGALGTWGWLENKVQSRIDAAVQAHDDGGSTSHPHPLLDGRIVTLEAREAQHLKDFAELRTECSRTRTELQEAYWWMVGDKAAELERDPRKRAAAARDARDQFLKYVSEGQSLDKAYQYALPQARLP